MGNYTSPYWDTDGGPSVSCDGRIIASCDLGNVFPGMYGCLLLRDVHDRFRLCNVVHRVPRSEIEFTQSPLLTMGVAFSLINLKMLGHPVNYSILIPRGADVRSLYAFSRRLMFANGFF